MYFNETLLSQGTGFVWNSSNRSFLITNWHNVPGYPYGLAGAGFPVWKRGSFATEPGISPAIQLHMFIDTASRPGMSGSPVIRRSWSTHLLEGNSISMGAATGTRFVGVYSGRL